MKRRGQTEWLDRGECWAIMPDGSKCTGTRRTLQPFGGLGSVDGKIALCFGHHRHYKKHKDPRTDIPLNAMQRMTFKERVEHYMNPTNGYIKITPYGCYEWQRTKLQAGYGLVNSKVIAAECGTKNNVQTHRMMWVYANGELPPDGMHVHHLCYNKACCNPEHLELLTPRENSNDAAIVHHMRVRYAQLMVKNRQLKTQIGRLEKELAEEKNKNKQSRTRRMAEKSNEQK